MSTVYHTPPTTFHDIAEKKLHNFSADVLCIVLKCLHSAIFGLTFAFAQR